MFWNRTKILPIQHHQGGLSAFPSAELLFVVEGGKEKLRTVWYRGNGEYSSSALLLEETPLVQIQCNGCPTCASLLGAGYGSPADSVEIQHLRDEMNQPYSGLEDALERLDPLLALLQSGVYILQYSSLCPTDGEGHFFWNVPEDFTPYPATTDFYDDDFLQQYPTFPLFLYPTQSAEKYDAQRVAYYRDCIREGRSLPPVITYQLESALCILLDGHHRASAYALEGLRVPSLTIATANYYHREEHTTLVWLDGSETPLSDLNYRGLEKKLNNPRGEYRQGDYPYALNNDYFSRHWEDEYAQMGKFYPTCYDAGVLGLYPNVEITVEGIQQFLKEGGWEVVTAAAHLLRYGAGQRGIDKKELAMVFTAPDSPSKLRLVAFQLLDTIKGDPEIEHLMVDILVNNERPQDPIYQIANSHWEVE